MHTIRETIDLPLMWWKYHNFQMVGNKI